MQNYRCKCGKTTSAGSMPPAQCERCPGCGSNLANHPDAHEEPQPHKIAKLALKSANGKEGGFLLCRMCARTHAEVLRLMEPLEMEG